MAEEEKTKLRLEIGHVLFIDVVGYSNLLVKQQSELLSELNEVVTATNEFREAELAGKLIRLPTGDGMALVFRTNTEAPAECAMEIAQALKSHPAIQLRMGIHSGPVNEVVDVNQRANIAGAGINMAQRVMDCGDAGHILLSRHVAEDLEQDDRWRPLLHDLGTCEVKHGIRVGVTNLCSDEVGNPQLPKKIQARRKRGTRMRWAALAAASLTLAAIVAGVARFSRYRAGSMLAAPARSIAVLPFENRSPDPDNAYFADGIQDEILTRLSKIADLKVISRTSTQHYKSAPENLPEIAKQLGVANILEGSVQKSGETVRVNVQLIKATNDSHLWADTFDRKLTDIFFVESEVAKAIADQLRAKLTGEEEQIIAARPTDNPEAYDAYLRALAYNVQTTYTPANALGAQKYLREAVSLDPKFALAWALLSLADSRGYITQSLEPTVALREEARQAAESALALQPNLGEALLATGNYYHACLKDYNTAVRYFEQARQFLPNNSQIPALLASVARRRGQWDRSESHFNQTERLDPRNVNLLGQHAQLYIELRRFPEALRKFDQVLDIMPGDVDTLAAKAAIAQAEGDLPRASALLALIHPPAEDPQALETQLYQAILERRPAQIIPRLKEILAKPDPALGSIIGELRFYLGWAQDLAGDHTAAQESWRRARSELEPFLKEQPENFSLMGNLALTSIGLGDKAAAFKLIERAMAVISIEKDAVWGPIPIEILGRVSARMGEPDRAMPALQKLLSIPYDGALAQNVPLTPALLRLDPMFDPVRNDARFQKLCESPQTK
jgi:TolB-like protein/class 3 adenylate cyclase/Tfp pilus assembly protein PilF